MRDLPVLFVYFWFDLQLLSWKICLFTGIWRLILYVIISLCIFCSYAFPLMQHCEQLCECNKDQQQLLYRYSLAELDDLELQLQSLDMANAYTCGIVGAKKKRGRPPNPVTKKVNIFSWGSILDELCEYYFFSSFIHDVVPVDQWLCSVPYKIGRSLVWKSWKFP